MGSSTDRNQSRSPRPITIPRAPAAPATPPFAFNPSPSGSDPFVVRQPASGAESPDTTAPPDYPSPPLVSMSVPTEPPTPPRLRYSAAYSESVTDEWEASESQRNADIIRKCLGAEDMGNGQWTKPRSDTRIKNGLPELLENLLPLSAGQIQCVRTKLDFVDPKEYTRPSATDGTDMKSFKRALEGLLVGPVEFDVWMIHEALWSGSLKDKDNLAMLQLALLGRENGDLMQMKLAYQKRYRKRENTTDSTGSGKSGSSVRGTWRIGGGTAAAMSSASLGDLYSDWKVQSGSLKGTEPALWWLFETILGGNEVDKDYQLPSTAEMGQVNPTKASEVKSGIEKEADYLRVALTSKPSANDLKRIATIFGHASCDRLEELLELFEKKHHKTVAGELNAKVAKKDPALYDMLNYILGGADPDRRDAMYIESTMEGAGTRELQLACRIVKCRWRTRKVAKAWEHIYPLGLRRKKNLMKYEKSMEARIQGEVSGLLKDLLMGILETERKR